MNRVGNPITQRKLKLCPKANDKIKGPRPCKVLAILYRMIAVKLP